MALSPNYGWSEPDNTDLVKNGAQAMRTLGDAIDTSVWNVGFGQAGKNKIINGDFSINQRNFTSTTNDNTFTFDRWRTYSSGTDQTYSAQTFTPGAAPVAGYEGKSFAQIATVGGAGKFGIYSYRIEDVRTFANQSMTVSFWAKANSGTPKIVVAPAQYFGTGGSATVTPTAQIVTISTSWTRYSVTFSMPSLSGKTIGTGSYLALEWTFNNDYNVNIGQQTNTFQFWGAQAEAGSKATPFQTASGGSIQGELAMCQRYYQRRGGASFGSASVFGLGFSGGVATQFLATVSGSYPVSFRTAPSVAYSGALRINEAGTNYTVTSISANYLTAQGGFLDIAVSGGGMTAGRGCNLIVTTDANAYLEMSAEL